MADAVPHTTKNTPKVERTKAAKESKDERAKKAQDVEKRGKLTLFKY